MTQALRPGFDQHVLTPVLGVMFRNRADSPAVSDGLIVTLKDPQQPNLSPQALAANGYGVFVAHQVRGVGAAGAASPPATRRYTLAVEDRLGRYLPMTMPVDLPIKGLLELACLATSPGASLPFVPLFNASTGTVPAGHAEVRVDLRLASNAQGAAWARLELWREDTDTLLAEGLADARGSALLVCALPALREPPLRASPPGSQAPLKNWSVSLRAFWNQAIARARVPDLCDLLHLPEVPLLQGIASHRPLAPALLTAGSPLVIRSDGSSCVFVGA
jgi:hypothetical protein